MLALLDCGGHNGWSRWWAARLAARQPRWLAPPRLRLPTAALLTLAVVAAGARA